ncbi:MAG: hypothetical protein ACRD4B_08790, partial [Acidobacteriota bacterium]
AMYRFNALKTTQSIYNEKLVQPLDLATPRGLDAILSNNEFLSRVTVDRGEIKKLLGLTDEEVASLDTPEGLKQLAQNERFTEHAEELQNRIFGDTDPTQVNALITDIEQAHLHVSKSEWKNRLKEYVARNPGKRLGILALILAGIPVAAAALAVGAAVSVGSGAARGGR